MGTLTQDEKDKIRDDAVAQWWKDWFEADYSWEGLTKFPWQGWKVVESKTAYNKYLKEQGLPEGCPNKACQVVPADFDGLPKGTKTREATLQDYWRDQEGKLDGQDGGKQYTIAHLPTYFADKVGSWKTNPDHENWQILENKVLALLLSAAPTEIQNLPKGAVDLKKEGRSNFQGCILHSLPCETPSNGIDIVNNSDSVEMASREGTVHINLHRAAILYTQRFYGTVFGSSVTFQNALFSGEHTSFGGAHFLNGDISFDEAIFSAGNVSFKDTHFSNNRVSFKKTQFLGGSVTFRNAEFKVKSTLFQSAKFIGGHANFRHTEFSGGKSSFFRAGFLGGPATFEDAIFSGGDVSFSNVQFSGGKTSFRNVKFTGGKAVFSNTEFTEDEADFSGAQFSGGDATFHFAVFSGRGVKFHETLFCGRKTFFAEARFSTENTSFDGACFSSNKADFNSTKFEKHLSFRNVKFESHANFQNTIFPPAEGSQNAFRGTQFLGSANFSRTKFTSRRRGSPPESELHFPFNAFGHADIKDQLFLTQRGDDEAQIEFDRTLTFIMKACQNKTADINEAHYVALEAGCTTLKHAMENISDKNRAQRYFKFELLARQRRPSTSPLIKGFTWLYGLTADYGGSIGRPLLALFTAWAIFTFGYLWNAWAVEVETAKPWQMLWGAMDFSATHIFRPLFIWSKNAASGDSDWVAQYHGQLSAGGWLTVKIFATIQSFLSITLLFLFGLATKRKFQMS